MKMIKMYCNCQVPLFLAYNLAARQVAKDIEMGPTHLFFASQQFWVEWALAMCVVRVRMLGMCMYAGAMTQLFRMNSYR